MFLKQYPGAPISAAIESSKNELKFGSPKFYSDYAPARTASAEDLLRGLKFMKCLIAEKYNIPPQKVRIPESGIVLNERMNLECEREISKAGKVKAKGSGKTQAKGARILGGAELINPFSLDNLTVAEESAPKKETFSKRRRIKQKEFQTELFFYCYFCGLAPKIPEPILIIFEPSSTQIL